MNWVIKEHVYLFVFCTLGFFIVNIFVLLNWLLVTKLITAGKYLKDDSYYI